MAEGSDTSAPGNITMTGGQSLWQTKIRHVPVRPAARERAVKDAPAKAEDLHPSVWSRMLRAISGM